jgi:hypothetical protein
MEGMEAVLLARDTRKIVFSDISHNLFGHLRGGVLDP